MPCQTTSGLFMLGCCQEGDEAGGYSQRDSETGGFLRYFYASPQVVTLTNAFPNPIYNLTAYRNVTARLQAVSNPNLWAEYNHIAGQASTISYGPNWTQTPGLIYVSGSRTLSETVMTELYNTGFWSHTVTVSNPISPQEEYQNALLKAQEYDPQPTTENLPSRKLIVFGGGLRYVPSFYGPRLVHRVRARFTTYWLTQELKLPEIAKIWEVTRMLVDGGINGQRCFYSYVIGGFPSQGLPADDTYLRDVGCEDRIIVGGSIIDPPLGNYPADYIDYQWGLTSFGEWGRVGGTASAIYPEQQNPATPNPPPCCNPAP